jgi:hypothetical protein
VVARTFGDRASVVVGGAVVGDAGAKADQVADARIREPDSTPQLTLRRISCCGR